MEAMAFSKRLCRAAEATKIVYKQSCCVATLVVIAIRPFSRVENSAVIVLVTYLKLIYTNRSPICFFYCHSIMHRTSLEQNSWVSNRIAMYTIDDA